MLGGGEGAPPSHVAAPEISGGTVGRRAASAPLLEYQLDLWQEGFDFGLNFRGVRLRTLDEAEGGYEIEGSEYGDALVGEGEISEFQRFELFHGGDELQVVVCHFRAVGESE